MNQFISISSGAYNGYNLETCCEEVAKIGATYIELIFIHGYSDPFEEDYFNNQNAQTVRQSFANNGLKSGAFSSHMDLTKDSSVEIFMKRMDFAREIGSNIIITYTGPLDQRSVFLKNIEVLADYAKRLELIIALENPGDANRSIIGSGKSAAELIKEIDSEHIKVNYDFGNLMSEYREDIRPEKDFKNVLNDIVHLHIKDTIRKDDGWRYPEIGKGEIDFVSIFRTIKEESPNIPMCLEIPLSMVLRDINGIPVLSSTPLSLNQISGILKGSLDYVNTLLEISN